MIMNTLICSPCCIRFVGLISRAKRCYIPWLLFIGMPWYFFCIRHWSWLFWLQFSKFFSLFCSVDLIAMCRVLAHQCQRVPQSIARRGCHLKHGDGQGACPKAGLNEVALVRQSVGTMGLMLDSFIFQCHLWASQVRTWLFRAVIDI